QAAACGDAAKVLSEIAIVVGLMIAAREELEHDVVVRFVTDLQGVHDDQPAAAPQHAGELSKNHTAYLRRQFVKHEDARHCILAFALDGKRLPFADHDVDPAPPLQLPYRLGDVSLRQIDTQHRQPRPSLLE